MTEAELVRVACPLCGATSSRFERTVRGFALARCRDCGFVFVNPQYPADGTADQYTSRVDPAALLAHYDRVITAATLAEYDTILTAIEGFVPGRGRLLDLGCGPCRFVERARGHGWTAYGVDLAPWVTEVAAQRKVDHIAAGTLVDQHYADALFDVVHAAQVLEHLPRPLDELGEVRRILRPGGLFYANVPNYRCLSIVLGRDDFELNTPMGHLNYFTPPTLSRLFRQAGFAVRRVSTFGGLKWENIVGRPYLSEEVKSVRGLPSAPAPPEALDEPPQPPWAKRLVAPLVKSLLYRGAKVGMTLEIFATRE